jgi:hypothetical protein
MRLPGLKFKKPDEPGLTVLRPLKKVKKAFRDEYFRKDVLRELSVKKMRK